MNIIGEGDGKISPEMRLFYQNKFERSVELFSKSLEGYQHAEFQQKREQYKKVMHQALSVMNDAAKAGLSEDAKRQAAKLNREYEEIVAQKKPQEILTATEWNQLQSQINKLKKIG